MTREELTRLDNSELNNYLLVVSDLKEGRFPEETNFELRLKNSEELKSENPIAWGKYFSGRGENYTPWIEMDYSREIRFNQESIDITKNDIDLELFQRIASVLPEGGRIMVIYAGHEETEKALQKNVPPPATEIGFLLFSAGCVWFKDWYFPEGYREGPVKLQGEKPVNEESRKRAFIEIHQELMNFLERSRDRDEELFVSARVRAEMVLEEINRSFPELVEDQDIEFEDFEKEVEEDLRDLEEGEKYRAVYRKAHKKSKPEND